MQAKRKVAVIGTGGTISSVGRHPYDTIDYGKNKTILGTAGVLALLPSLPDDVEVIVVPFREMISTAIYFDEWRALLECIDGLMARTPDLSGIVITHGTATLEESAWFLHLTLGRDIPLVLVGAQRPSNALSSDAGMNLYNAIRVAAAPASRGLGVLVVVNDEIHAAREVTKTSTYRLQTFRSPDMGLLGHCDADAVCYYRQPLRAGGVHSEFDVRSCATLPDVGIVYSYAGADGDVVRYMVASGKRGIVAAGFAPGGCTPADLQALKQAAAAGVSVVMSTRAGSGRVGAALSLQEQGFIPADNLNPQKARLLLALALTKYQQRSDIVRLFQTY